jgi:hypothetical protein
VGALCKITWPWFGGRRIFFCFRSIVPEKKTVRVARASSGFHIIISPTRVFPSSSSSFSSSVTLFTVHIITTSGARPVVWLVRIYCYISRPAMLSHCIGIQLYRSSICLCIFRTTIIFFSHRCPRLNALNSVTAKVRTGTGRDRLKHM